VLQKVVYLGLDLAARDHATGDLRRGARDVGDRPIGELEAGACGDPLDGLGGIPRGARGLARPVRVSKGAIDRDRGVPGVDLVADGVAREGAGDATDAVARERVERVGELPEVHDPYSRHICGTSWGISGFPAANSL
jgi:hypothetical protein